MEATRRKLDEADDIAEVIDLMQNSSIPSKGCKNIGGEGNTGSRRYFP